MKIDVTKISGYDSMSAEEKVAALESYDANVVSKDVFDKTASDLAAKKKELAAHLSAEEQAKEADREARESLQTAYDTLQRQFDDLMKKPVPDGGSNTMTLDALRKMSVQERAEYYRQNPEEYKALYSGGKT